MNIVDKLKLGIELKRLRLENELTLEEVAKHLGLTHKSVQFWEQGKNEIRLTNLIQIAKLYGTSLDDILNNAGL